MRKFFLEYFNYSAKELSPLYCLVIILLLSIIFRSSMNRQEMTDYMPDYEMVQKNQAFIDGLKSPEIAVQSSYENENIKAIQPYYFDPNTIEADQLKDFGFNEKVISNLCKYRDAGGRFFRPIDMKKIYGLDEELYKYLEKWISIKPFSIKIDSTLNLTDRSVERDSVFDLELNSLVFKDMVKLTWGDAKLAGRILNYRNLLGGFSSKKQLREVFDMNDTLYESICSAVRIDTILIVPLSLNNSEYSDLLRHPYLERDDVNLILKYRKFKNSNIYLRDFLESKLLADSILQKMRPYLRN